MPGWEFELLRALSLNTATDLYWEASHIANSQMRKSGQFWVVMLLSYLFISLNLVIGWFVAVNFAIPPFVFDFALGVVTIHPLARWHYKRYLLKLRGALSESMLLFVQDELERDSRRRRRSLQRKKAIVSG